MYTALSMNIVVKLPDTETMKFLVMPYPTPRVPIMSGLNANGWVYP
jgi:hypothetical protein